jgi:hypothetical protein
VTKSQPTAPRLHATIAIGFHLELLFACQCPPGAPQKLRRLSARCTIVTFELKKPLGRVLAEHRMAETYQKNISTDGYGLHDSVTERDGDNLLYVGKARNPD